MVCCSNLDISGAVFCLFGIGSNCGAAAWTISIMGGGDLTKFHGKWSVGQILLLLLGVSLFLWGAAAKVAIVVLRLLHSSGT